MRTLALDVGSKRIGVAVSDALGLTAQPLTTVQRSSDEDALAAIDKIVSSSEIDKIVVGLPLNLDGTDSQQTEAVRQFCEKLRRRFRRRATLITWDERLSTAAAERSLLEADLSRQKRRRVIDKMSAVYILQGYLAAQSPPDLR